MARVPEVPAGTLPSERYGMDPLDAIKRDAEEQPTVKSDRPDPDRIAKIREHYTEVIEALPRGALSGGIPQVDEFDPATWVWFPDEEGDDGLGAKNRAFAREYLGITPETASEKLTLRERRELHRLADLEVDQITRADLEKEDRLTRQFKTVADEMWPEYVMAYPELAADPQGAQQAMGRLMRSSGLNLEQLIHLGRERREEVLARIADEQMIGADRQRMAEWDRANGFDGENRTGGIAGGGSAPSGPKEEDDGPSIADTIAAWQRKHKFTP